MSTHHYLRCDAHTPHLYSEDVGQHDYDLPDIQGYLANREELVRAVFTYDMTPGSHFARNAIRFLSDHPHCPISIEDERGETHPTRETP